MGNEKEKVHINIMFIGHVDSGKSTTAGHLIYKLGGIDKSVIDKEAGGIDKSAWVLNKLKSEQEIGITIDMNVIERIEKEAAEISKRPNKYAWVLDRLKSDHERGIKIDIDLYKFETTKYYCTVIDAPGHKDSFLKTMITRTSQPDCVVLIIDSTTSGFETSKDRQARALVHLSFVFGVKNLICCCNKMDATIPKYSKDRLVDIVLKHMRFLSLVGYSQLRTLFIPISASEGDNLIESSKSTNIGWYKGPTLLEALDRIEYPKRPSIKADRNTVPENANCSESQPPKKMRMESGPHLDEKQVRSIVDEIKQVITASSKRKLDRADEWYCEDDEEQVELINEEIEQEKELFHNIGDCLGTLIKMFRASFLPFFGELSSYLTPMFGKDKTTEERMIVIRIICDVAEHCGEAALKYYGSFIPLLLEACDDECSDVRQAANFIRAKLRESVSKPPLGETVSSSSIEAVSSSSTGAAQVSIDSTEKATVLVKTDTQETD